MEKNKKLALDSFTTKLRRSLKDKLYGVYLFGSLPKGMSTLESDIDVLVIFSNLERGEILQIVSDIAFQVAWESGEVIEPVLMSEKEFKRSLEHSPFLWEVLNYGETIFVRDKTM